jgi:hypothetical protein
MIPRAVAVWAAIIPLAIANGAFRILVLIPRVGEPLGQLLSALILAALVLLVALAAIRWIGPRTPTEAWSLGGIWLAATISFEFLAGHYLFGVAWAELRAQYDLLAGEPWVLVLAATFVAPAAAARVRRLHAPARTRADVASAPGDVAAPASIAPPEP